MRMGMKAWATSSAIAMTMLTACGSGEPIGASSSELAQGAVYTTFDAREGGCLDSPNGINCNEYTSADKVYLSGGPLGRGLEDGAYFFAIVSPGNGKGALTDGASENLSSAAGSTMSERRFRISNGQIEPGSHSPSRGTGWTSNGRFAIQAHPFAPTSNAGGVYVLAVCKEGATSPKDCNYDNFKVEARKDDDCNYDP